MTAVIQDTDLTTDFTQEEQAEWGDDGLPYEIDEELAKEFDAMLLEYEVSNKQKHTNVNTIRSNQLVSLVAASSGYESYEVKDVLEHFAIVLRDLVINKDYKVKVAGLGLFSTRIYRAKIMQCNFGDTQRYRVPERKFLSFATDPLVADLMNPDRGEVVPVYDFGEEYGQ